MAERIVQEESLATVADAIRAKGGTTDPLSFPDGFKTAIEAIQAGGGGMNIVTGTITPSKGTTELEIEHNLGAIPKFAFIYGKSATSGNTYAIWHFNGVLSGNARHTSNGMTYSATYTSPPDITATSAADGFFYNATTTTIKVKSQSSSMPFPNNECRWVVGV